MNFITIFCFFIVIFATASCRHVYEIVDSSEDIQEEPRLRVRRDYGCGIWSSSDSECNENCRARFGCNWGRCEGKLSQHCRCKNQDNSYC